MKSMLKPIQYDNLSPKQQEIYNFQKIAAILADFGYNCIKLQDDWMGADFLAYHKDSDQTLRVQLKGRATIGQKYQGQDLYIAFPIGDNGRRDWYLLPHDKLVELVKKNTNWLNTRSWKERGGYSAGKPNHKLRAALESWRLREAR